MIDSLSYFGEIIGSQVSGINYRLYFCYFTYRSCFDFLFFRPLTDFRKNFYHEEGFLDWMSSNA